MDTVLCGPDFKTPVKSERQARRIKRLMWFFCEVSAIRRVVVEPVAPPGREEIRRDHIRLLIPGGPKSSRTSVILARKEDGNDEWI
jgi:hypothetical protein